MTATNEQFSCQELVELLTSYMEGALPDDERAAFEQHLEGCDGCHAYLDQMRATIELTGSARQTGLSADAEAKLLAAFHGLKSK